MHLNSLHLSPVFAVASVRRSLDPFFFNSTLLNIAQSGAGEFLFIILYTSFGLKTLDDVSSYFIPVLLFAMFGNLTSIGILISVLKKRDKLQVFRFFMLVLIFLGILWFASLVPTLIEMTKPAYSSTGIIPNGMMTTSLIIFLGCFAVSGIVMVGCFYIQSMFVRDLIIFDTFINYINRENVYQTAMSVPSSLCSSVVANLFIGLIYSTGYNERDGYDSAGKLNSDSNILAIKYNWNDGTIIQSASYLLFFSVAVGYSAYWIMSDYGLTTPIAAEMEKVNAKREEDKNAAASAAVTANDVNVSNPMNAIINSMSSESGEATSSTENDYLAPPSGKNNSNSSSTKSNTALPAFDGIQCPFSADDEKNIMMHFSALENKVIYESSANTDGKNVGLNRIHNSILLGGFCIGPLAMGALIWGVFNQIKEGLTFATVLLTLFLAASIYVGYEILRFIALKKLYNLPASVVHTLAQRQVYRNANYSVSLKELLESNVIGDNMNDPNDDNDGLINRLTYVKKSNRRPITEDVPEEEEHHNLSGYKRIYFAFSLLFAAGVLAILQKK